MFKCYRPLSTRNLFRPKTTRILFSKENTDPHETEEEEFRGRINETHKPPLPRKAWKKGDKTKQSEDDVTRTPRLKLKPAVPTDGRRKDGSRSTRNLVKIQKPKLSGTNLKSDALLLRKYFVKVLLE